MTALRKDEPKDAESGLTQEIVRDIFAYDPEEGILRWRKKISKKTMVGAPVGTLFYNKKTGKPASLRVTIFGHAHEVHRVIWLYMTGKWPAYIIDHKDRNEHGINNEWNNLREADRSINTRNSAVRYDNDLGLKGVIEVNGGFKAEIMFHGRVYRLGTYTTKEEALASRRGAIICLFGEYSAELESLNESSK